MNEDKNQGGNETLYQIIRREKGLEFMVDILMSVNTRLESELENSLTDKTGTLNRNGYEQVVKPDLLRSLREGESWCVLYADLNNLKGVNDSEGHSAGDRALDLAAKSMLAEKRPRDYVVRTGGDEFLIFLSQVDIDKAKGVATRIFENFELKKPEDIAVSSIAIGIAKIDGQTQVDLDTAIENAETVMYKTKRDQKYAAKSHYATTLINLVEYEDSMGPEQQKDFVSK